MQEPSNLGVAQEAVRVLACSFDYLLVHAVYGGYESHVQLYLREPQYISRVKAG